MKKIIKTEEIDFELKNIDCVVRRLCDGLKYSDNELLKIKTFLIEYQIANQLSLMEIDELCFDDSNWIFDQVF